MARSVGGASEACDGRASFRYSININCPDLPSLDPMPLRRHALGNLREEPSAGKPHARICEGEAEWLSYSTIPPVPGIRRPPDYVRFRRVNVSDCSYDWPRRRGG